MKNPEQCKFAKTHEWIADDGTVGISDHAQKEITDVVFVELPKVGKEIQAGQPVAVVESVKAAFDIYAPISGKISKINDSLIKNPGQINSSPYDSGWLFTIEKTGEDSALMTYSDYQNFLESDTH